MNTETTSKMPAPGDRVSYTTMYDLKPDTRYETHYGRITSVWPRDVPVMCRIAVENPRPHETRYVTRKLRDVALAPQNSHLHVGQRVRLIRGGRGYTGRVTKTWQIPVGTQPGVDVTMDNQYSPQPIPVRYHVPEDSFEPLPDDYLDNDEAMELLARTVTHIPGDWAQAAEMLSTVLDTLRRNERTGDGA